MKRKTTDQVRESFLTNHPEKDEKYSSHTGNFVITEILNNGEYKLNRTTEYLPLGQYHNRIWYSLFKLVKVFGVFPVWKRVDVADIYLPPLFADFIRRK